MRLMDFFRIIYKEKAQKNIIKTLITKQLHFESAIINT